MGDDGEGDPHGFLLIIIPLMMGLMYCLTQVEYAI